MQRTGRAAKIREKQEDLTPPGRKRHLALLGATMMTLSGAISMVEPMSAQQREKAELPAAGLQGGSGAILSQFGDPCLGGIWQLTADPHNPQSPGHLILVHKNLTFAHLESLGEGRQVPRQGRSTLVEAGPTVVHPSMPPVVIRPGDRVVVHQESAKVEGQFEAVALEMARTGQSVRVRLRAVRNAESENSGVFATPINGPILTVQATGPGAAQLNTARRGDL